MVGWLIAGVIGLVVGFGIGFIGGWIEGAEDGRRQERARMNALSAHRTSWKRLRRYGEGNDAS